MPFQRNCMKCTISCINLFCSYIFSSLGFILHLKLRKQHQMKGVMRDPWGCLVVILPVQRDCMKCTISCIYLWINRLIHLFFLLIFLVGSILSFTDFLLQIFTSHGSVRCVLSYKGYYLGFFFVMKNLTEPLYHQRRCC